MIDEFFLSKYTKQLIYDFINVNKNKFKYDSLLLCGESGHGKRNIAIQIANELGYNFIDVLDNVITNNDLINYIKNIKTISSSEIYKILFIEYLEDLLKINELYLPLLYFLKQKNDNYILICTTKDENILPKNITDLFNWIINISLPYNNSTVYKNFLIKKMKENGIIINSENEKMIDKVAEILYKNKYNFRDTERFFENSLMVVLKTLN